MSSGSPSGSSSTDELPFQPVRWAGDALELIDQTRLPTEEVWLRCERPEEVADAIRRLAVRGAPAIGVAAAYGLALGARDGAPERVDEVHELLAATRPTAVNLRWALDRAQSAREGGYEAVLAVAHEIAAEQMRADRAMARHAAALFSEGDRALTHCNTGPLATAGFGTALGALNQAWIDGRLSQVWVDETRPLLQGARLTAWELERLGIPFQVVPDASAGALMSRGLVDRIVVGADRIAANGDVANKIGTYTLAVLAQRHAVPFYVIAPLSTIDPATPTGADIPIEERDPSEVTSVGGVPLAPDGAPALNLAFDVTPAELVTAIVTEAGVLEPPYEKSITQALAQVTRGSG
ncbi:MAG TPA: S-methyl-5-thioribose-1-phosphate isomerase [Thermoleophilaceae bacterium]